MSRSSNPNKGSNFNVKLPEDLRLAIQKLQADRQKKGMPCGLKYMAVEALRWLVALHQIELCEQCTRALIYNAADRSDEPASIRMNVQHELAHFILVPKRVK